ncbi:uncharacterized protein F5891DRAFT_986109 [Suillus fuscotomentosus]|uniref:Uncharacterized protein n=1 Tax=Suillus fuscotomentosus TaxID=1912939 RepID=A0AAD4DSU9_9AGAM|nr:uncharacterized protein F5891DRAFT_986109 [Suillus fuscotomentosus]KAG1893192.1 hypothetical protein F5891DRAFT_986109 [Suillus fuscotomentosus]
MKKKIKKGEKDHLETQKLENGRTGKWEWETGRTREPEDGRQETGDRRQETGDRRREMGDGGRRETGDGRRETGDGRRETGDGRQETGDRRQETGLAWVYPRVSEVKPLPLLTNIPSPTVQMYNFKILYVSITPMVINLGIYSQGYRGLQVQIPTPTLKGFPYPC